MRLANLKIASPCKERWEDMVGDARVRVCAGCERPVFNLSEMTMEDAEAVLATRGVTPCVRFYRRADGTVMTSDCPTARRPRRVAIAAAAGVIAAASATAAVAHLTRSPEPIETPMEATELLGDPTVYPESELDAETPPEAWTGVLVEPVPTPVPEMGPPPRD